MDDPRRRLIITVVADIPDPDIEVFQEYESLVLPLLERHTGRLERRLRTADGTVEVHVVSFGSRAGYESYLADPERVAHGERMRDSHVNQRSFEVHDV